MLKKTVHVKPSDVTRKWYLFDAKDNVLGRMSTAISTVLMGKNTANYSPHMDSGNYVVVINADKVKLTGLKPIQKVYRGHSGYPGGFKEVSFEKMMEKDSARVIEHAVSGMLPDNRLKSKRLSRLKVFTGNEHPYKDKFKA